MGRETQSQVLRKPRLVGRARLPGLPGGRLGKGQGTPATGGWDGPGGVTPPRWASSRVPDKEVGGDARRDLRHHSWGVPRGSCQAPTDVQRVSDLPWPRLLCARPDPRPRGRAPPEEHSYQVAAAFPPGDGPTPPRSPALCSLPSRPGSHGLPGSPGMTSSVPGPLGPQEEVAQCFPLWPEAQTAGMFVTRRLPCPGWLPRDRPGDLPRQVWETDGLLTISPTSPPAVGKDHPQGGPPHLTA